MFVAVCITVLASDLCVSQSRALEKQFLVPVTIRQIQEAQAQASPEDNTFKIDGKDVLQAILPDRPVLLPC